MTEIIRATLGGYPIKRSLRMITRDFSCMPGFVTHCTGLAWLVRSDPEDSRTNQVYYGRLAISECRRFALLLNP